jgi:hypothetical protein
MKHAYTSIEYLTPTFGEQGTGTKRPDKDTVAQCALLSERKFTNHILQLQGGRMLPVRRLNRK